MIVGVGVVVGLGVLVELGVLVWLGVDVTVPEVFDGDEFDAEGEGVFEELLAPGIEDGG